MTTAVSENLYKASWLAPIVRVAAWPISLFLFLVGLLWRLLGFVPAMFRGGDAERGIPDAKRRLRDLSRAGFRYLTFQSNEIPPLSGVVRGAGESHGPWHEARRRLCKSHVAMASSLGFLAYVYVGLLAQFGVIATEYDASFKEAAYARPGSSATVSLTSGETVDRTFPLGTDATGRNVLHMTLRGVTTALWIGVVAALISCVIGVILGAVGGYFGGWIDDIIVWMYTTLSSIPYLLLLLSFSFVINNTSAIREAYDASFMNTTLGISLGLCTIILAVGLTSWVGVCRIVRAEFLKHRDRDYVVAARSFGFSSPRILFRHILPNVLPLVLISYSLLFVSAIKFEVILSFLGLGLEAKDASWGAMISEAKLELLRSPSIWWQITAATVALFFLVLFVNLLADALRDALDPRLRS